MLHTLQGSELKNYFLNIFYVNDPIATKFTEII